MGPRSFNRGKLPRSRIPSSEVQPFNGASVFQPRKDVSRHVLRVAKVVPSMGPRSFNRGKHAVVDHKGRGVGPLQWGLGLSTEERRITAGALARTVFLQWGLGLSTEERMVTEIYGREQYDPFNGASVFQPRKGGKVRPETILDPFPSMGPRSFNRGKDRRNYTRHTIFRPSMGPRSFNRGKGGAAINKGPNCGPSMGPRSFNRGKSAFLMTSRSRVSVLQWGLGLSTEESATWAGSAEDVCHPSMGPRSFNRGKPSTGNRHGPLSGTFNGASVFQPRKVWQGEP